MEMKVVNSEQMYEIDRLSIRDYKIPDLLLMENAGRSAAEYIFCSWPDKKQVVIFAGPGNNGGDGLVLARHLFQNDYQVTVFFAGDLQKRTRANRINFTICKKLKIPLKMIKKDSDLKKYKSGLVHTAIIVDALLGIGFKNRLKEPFLEIISFLNQLQGPVKIALDIPSGLSAGSYQAAGPAFRAQTTVTFGLPKIAHLLSPARAITGKLIIKNIGFPQDLLSDKNIKLNLLTRETVRPCLPERVSYFHKNDYGHLAAFTGSSGKSGASVLSASAALRSGSGLVSVISQPEVCSIIAHSIPEIMTISLNPVGETDSNEITSLLDKADVILSGCGIGLSSHVRVFLQQLFQQEKKIFILDADALNIIADDLSLLNRKNQYVLTPHIGEFSRLLKKDKKEVEQDLLALAADFAVQHQVILVLKSAETIIAHPESGVFINIAGNDGMATAGSGDVLAGIIAGLAAQNVKQNKSLLNSVQAGVYLHALSGDLACSSLGKYSLNAHDIITALPQAFQEVLSC